VRSVDKAPAWIFVLFAGAAFAASSPLARYARPTHPLVIATGRLVLAAIIMLAIDARSIGASVRGLSSAARLRTFAAGALLAAHFALFQIGLDRTSLPAAVSLVSLQPLAVVLCAWILLGMQPSRAEQLGVLVATIGAVVVGQGQGRGEHRLSGDLFVIAAVVLYGLYLTVARSLKDALPARSYVALVYTSAAASLAAALPIIGLPEGALPPPRHGVIAISAIAIIPTVLGHSAVQIASRSRSPSIVALVSPGETLGAIAIGAALFGATPTTTEIVGAAIILAGTILALITPKGRAP
jgi:drug/metabolite transporter (DMT)-like permease